MRALSFLIILLMHSHVAWAECVSITQLFTETLPKAGGHQWVGHQLKRDGEVWHLLFTNSSNAWVLAARQDQPEIYCIKGRGTRIDVLVSLHDTNFNDPFGLPGSGSPRCGRAGDPLEGIKVRGWASRELGDSLILSLDDGKPATFVLLLSKAGGYWTLLRKATGETTCYHDRGSANDVREFTLRQ